MFFLKGNSLFDPQLVWIETPTNPMLKLTDIQAVADIVHQSPGAMLAVDNTFMSSYFQVTRFLQSFWVF
jgi:cystathionine beta-lyase/cystathionine gamma-synthase